MTSTPISCTSDYYSSSDIDYEDNDYDFDVVKAAPSKHCSIDETNFTIRTFAEHHDDFRSSSKISSTVKVQQSIRLFELTEKFRLNKEIFIRANAILTKYLLTTSADDIDESILVACLSLSTKLSQHSSSRTFCDNLLISDENTICNALDWDIDATTPINYIETILVHIIDTSIRHQLREIANELLVLCLTNVRCVDLSNLSLGIGCLLMASELLQCGEMIPKKIFAFDQEKHALFETTLIYIRQVLIQILNH
ncbi:unnamed protein product [Adineta ricciae]|uniref:Cyclin N-terminal domain-containing protein n=1 Tax=Adineta ricciae TaxID=249248 RepID=A0A815GS67_ADIRI|nr:unnamed protein product [Adineta ricciae]